jgi:hypothetical protein
MKLDRARGAQSLYAVLESAVVLNWTDLMKNAGSCGRLHLEYACAPDSSLDCLKLWSSNVRGCWRLACEYWMSAAADHGKGIHFEDGFRSDGLSETLEFLMQHQQAFSPSSSSGRSGLLQIQSPTVEAITAAAKSVRWAYCRVNSCSQEPAVA